MNNENSFFTIHHWWLAELPMWLTNDFFTTFFLKGQCAYTLIYLQLTYTVINMQDGGGGIPNFGKQGLSLVVILLLDLVKIHRI